MQRALLLGDSMDMAHALWAAGALTTVIGGKHAPARYSRHGFAWLPDPRPRDEDLVRMLRELGSTTSPPALFYETDRDLLFVSRNREALGVGLAMLLPPPGLVEQLVSKGAFAALSRQLDLPVPQSWSVNTTESDPLPEGPYPLLVKPMVRDTRWDLVARGKAVVVQRPKELARLIESLAETHAEVVVQAYVPGEETRVESYHVYVDSDGEVAAEFTGCKIRTLPLANGYSTALVTTCETDVRDVGRSVVDALGLVGVAKLDFKRDPQGRLWLLEVNPRFNLWHHLGAAAGVNIPAFVLADLARSERPAAAVARPGVSWCNVPRDLVAARASGLGVVEWWRWARTCEAVTGLELTDPLPFFLGKLLPWGAAHLHWSGF